MAVAPRAAIYVRVSTGGQEEDGTSLVTQEAACRKYAADCGYELSEAHVYRETFSGAYLNERHELAALRKAVEQRQVDVIVIYVLDRLSRKQTHVAILFNEIEEAGARFESPMEDYENGTLGTLIRQLRAFAAELEREKIGERTGRGRRARAEAGLFMPGFKPPYGYLWRPDATLPGHLKRWAKPGLDEDPETSWVVRRIFAEAARGDGLDRIAEALTQDGIPTPTGRGSRWGHTTVRCILKSPIYTGRAEAFKVSVRKDPRKATKHKLIVTPRPEDERVVLPEGVAPPLIDTETFATVQERFQTNMVRAKRARREPERVLLRGGYVRCGYCGHTMFVHRNGERLSYRCIRRQRHKDCPGATHKAESLDREAWERVKGLLTDPHVIVQQLELLERDDPTANDLATIDRSIGQIQVRRRNLLGQLGLLDPDSAADVREMLADAGRRVKELEASRSTVLAQREARQQARNQLAELQSWCRAVAANLGGLTYDQRRLALDALGVSVSVWRRDDRPPRIDMSIPLGGVTSSSTSRSAGGARTTTPESRMPRTPTA